MEARGLGDRVCHRRLPLPRDRVQPHCTLPRDDHLHDRLRHGSPRAGGQRRCRGEAHGGAEQARAPLLWQRHHLLHAVPHDGGGATGLRLGHRRRGDWHLCRLLHALHAAEVRRGHCREVPREQGAAGAGHVRRREWHGEVAAARERELQRGTSAVERAVAAAWPRPDDPFVEAGQTHQLPLPQRREHVRALLRRGEAPGPGA
mmetsp:Transcript_31459/g.78393  ORF Transcript_31459/g.78393 Transcript_31459/m.78393 type:complete len:203 (-) Transcript_31459:499-1107(-)